METLYLTETGGGGRCFFNSLYYALRERNLLNNLEAIGITQVTTLQQFTYIMRGILVDRLDQGVCNTYFEQIKNISVSGTRVDTSSLEGLLQPWEIKIFEKNIRNPQQFCKEWLETINENITYVSDVMIQTIKELLLEVGITLETITDNDPVLRNAVTETLLTDPIKGTYTTYIIQNDFPIYNPEEPKIYLVNETYGGGHFKFFSQFNISNEQYKQNKINLSAALPDVRFSNPAEQQRFLSEKTRASNEDTARRKVNEFFKKYGGRTRRGRTHRSKTHRGKTHRGRTHRGRTHRGRTHRSKTHRGRHI